MGPADARRGGLGRGEQPAVRARSPGLHAAAREPASSAEGGRQPGSAGSDNAPGAPAPLPALPQPGPGRGAGVRKVGWSRYEFSPFSPAKEHAKISEADAGVCA